MIEPVTTESKSCLIVFAGTNSIRPISFTLVADVLLENVRSAGFAAVANMCRVCFTMAIEIFPFDND
jgi:hypothetical protein